ncbi:hypothetical protein BGX23_001015 [Mortierella sp. AD031]|nr:hypothetical protein BGX23_001015 [Mortierella sp. AD031]KAG0198632.1 hypothetical protein BGX33_012208 [Mortierella sp. NVP41]
MPEIVRAIGLRIPLFGRRFVPEIGVDGMIVSVLDPKPLLDATGVCAIWRREMFAVLWHAFDYKIMRFKIPNEAMIGHFEHDRLLSLLDIRRSRNIELWRHSPTIRISRGWRTRDSLFPVIGLIDTNEPALMELRLSDPC